MAVSSPMHWYAVRLSLAGLLIGSLMPSVVSAQTPARMLVDTAFQKGNGPIKFDFKDHPAIKVGKKLQIDFRLRFQKDKRTSDAPFDADVTDVDIAKKRIGVE